MEGSSPQVSIDQAHRKRRRQSSISGDSPREFGHMRTHPQTKSTTFVGSGSGIHFVRTVQLAFAKNNLTNASDTLVDEELVPGEDDRLHSQNSSNSLWREDEASPSGSSVLSTFDDLVRWTRSYFDSWHPPFPFLHAPTVLSILEKLSMSGWESVAHDEGVIIRSIMSISVADRRQMPRDDGSLVPTYLIFQTIDEALGALQPMLISPSSLPSLQAIVSIQLFLISMLRLNAASRIGGLVVRIACHLGLHRCPTRFKQFSVAEVEIRRRLFWSIYTLERYLSQALGLPLDLKDDDLDVCYSNQELHQASLAESGRLENSHNPSLLVLPAFLAKHGKIKGLILELRNKSVLHSRTDPDEVAHVDAEISKWWNEAQDLVDPDFMDNDTSMGQSPAFGSVSSDDHVKAVLKPSHILLLIVQKHESVLLLNRPVITSGYNTSAFAGAMQKCIGASKQIISHIYKHLNENRKLNGSQDGRSQNPLFWPGFVWMVWQSGLILLYAAFEGYYPVHIAQREADRCRLILDNISSRGNFWSSACASGIKHLQAALDRNGTSDSNVAQREPISATRFQSPRMSAPHIPDSGHSGGIRDQSLSNSFYGFAQTSNSTHASTLDHQSDRRTTYSRIEANQNHNSNIPLFGNPGGQVSESTQDTGEIQPHNIPPETPVTDRGNFLNIPNPEGFDFWQNANGTFSRPGEQLEGFENIFPLMDMSYLLSE